MKRILAAMVVLVCASGMPAPVAAQGTQNPERLRVAVDGVGDLDYLRTELNWVEYVRDRQVADVHVFVTNRSTGPGGREYTLEFIGRGTFQAKTDTVTWISSVDDTDDVRRQGLVGVIKMGLMRYVASTPLANRVTIAVAAGEEGTSAAPPRDPWNAWVFAINGNGYFAGQSLQNFSFMNLSLSANRITAAWKVRTSVNAAYNEDNFELNDSTDIKSVARSYSGSVLVAKSIGPRLSAGIQTGVESSTFGNVELAWRIAPGIEFDVFPYSESTRRSFTILYTAGLSSWDYRERTIYDEIGETRPTHALWFDFSTRQPWGNTTVRVRGSQFLHDTDKYRWSGSLFGDVRLFRGFSVGIGASYSRILDQLALPAGEASEAEILLRRRQLQTNYSFSLNFGIQYRFGSIFNTVVNPRFASGIGSGSVVEF